jgi:catechol 2,3-dioxygenase
MPDERFFQSVELTELTLRVKDLAHVQAFYEDVLGFTRLPAPAGSVALAPPGAAQALVVLHAAPNAAPRPRGAAGLFHVAFLYPDRAALARVLRRLLDLDVSIGSADHGVSEAIYLSDPEGNGIELYADRRQDAWPPRMDDGQVAMYTDALDIPALLALARKSEPLLPEGTRIGHIHLSVADLGHAEHFFSNALGFGVTQRSYPGALFMGRDGYHHHIGANIWRSHQAATPGTLGLAEFTLRLSQRDDFATITTRLTASGYLREPSDSFAVAQDRDGLMVRVLVDGGRSGPST